MRRADQVGGLCLLVFGVWFSMVALQYSYWGATGPGSGFFPFWLGVAMAALAALLLVGATRSSDPGASWLPEGLGLRRLLTVLGATTLLIPLMKAVGMVAGTVLFLVVILRGVERYGWGTALAIALGSAAANHLIFVRWLGVPLPSGLLGF